MITVMVLVSDDETGEKQFYQHEYEHMPTLIGVEHNPDLRAKMSYQFQRMYSWWQAVFGAEFNMLDSDAALGTLEQQDRFWTEVLRANGITTKEDVERLLGEEGD